MFDRNRSSSARGAREVAVPGLPGTMRRIAVLTAVLVASMILPVRAGQGFGAATQGGIGKSLFRVTSLADSGPGSLRDAVSKGGRYVVFDVAGTIHLSSDIRVLGAYITIDGSKAPSPGITLRNYGLDIDGNHADVHDVVVHNIRIRDPRNDGIAVEWGAHHVHISNVSIDGCGDGNIDITRYAHDVTVAWSVFSGCAKNMLIKYEAQRVTLHHNVFIHSQWRNPWISYTTEHTNNLSPDTMVDMRNNLVWGWGESGGGTGIECGAKANLVNNYFSSPNTSASRQANAIIMKTSCSTGGHGAYAYTFGNVSADGLKKDLNSLGNRSTPYAAAFVDTHDACIGARDALARAGAVPLDSIDLGHLSQITLPGCTSGSSTSAGATTTSTSSTSSTSTTSPSSGEQLFQSQIAGRANDADETWAGRVSTSSRPLRFGTTRALNAFRFTDVTIPPGATILSAKLRFHVTGNGAVPISSFYWGEKTASSTPFESRSGSLSTRPRTGVFFYDVPPPWPTGVVESRELAGIVQEIVRERGWAAGNALTLFVGDAGSAGYRKVASADTSTAKAAVLVVRWRP
jgi:pectate lyase